MSALCTYAVCCMHAHHVHLCKRRTRTHTHTLSLSPSQAVCEGPSARALLDARVEDAVNIKKQLLEDAKVNHTLCRVCMCGGSGVCVGVKDVENIKEQLLEDAKVRLGLFVTWYVLV